MTPRWRAVVPTLGRSPHLRGCLEALRRDGGPALFLVMVDQSPRAGGDVLDGSLTAQCDEVRRPPAGRVLSFAAATNLGLQGAGEEFVATVNDDALVEPGWSAALLAALAGAPRASAAQGVNLLLDDPRLADGCGLAWNEAGQAVQRAHRRPAPAAEEAPREVFGVSATAAVYRARALRAVAREGAVFDPRLGSYYEDVDLAVRLRAAGFTALLVPEARARHAGSATGGEMPFRRMRWLHRNQHLVLARLLGSRFWPRLPRLLRRSLADAARALGRGEPAAAAGIAAGLAAALVLLPAWARRGAPLLPPEALERFRE